MRKNGKKSELTCADKGILRFKRRIFVPNIGELRKETLEEAYYSTYAMHPGSMKMYRNLKEYY